MQPGWGAASAMRDISRVHHCVELFPSSEPAFVNIETASKGRGPIGVSDHCKICMPLGGNRVDLHCGEWRKFRVHARAQI